MSRAWRQTWEDFTLYLGLLGFAPEVPFAGLSGKRRWRFDFAHEGTRVCIEYQGKGVGHQGIAGSFRDHEKTTEAQLCGWIVIQCNAKTVSNGQCHTWIERALSQAQQSA